MTHDLQNAGHASEWPELALLPARIATETALAFLSLSMAWLVPWHAASGWHDRHDQLVVPEPIECDGEHGLFA